MIEITKDNFVWKVLSEEEALVLFPFIQLFEVREKGIDALIENEEQLKEAMGSSSLICLEVGFVRKDMINFDDNCFYLKSK